MCVFAYLKNHDARDPTTPGTLPPKKTPGPAAAGLDDAEILFGFLAQPVLAKLLYQTVTVDHVRQFADAAANSILAAQKTDNDVYRLVSAIKIGETITDDQKKVIRSFLKKFADRAFSRYAKTTLNISGVDVTMLRNVKAKFSDIEGQNTTFNPAGLTATVIAAAIVETRPGRERFDRKIYDILVYEHMFPWRFDVVREDASLQLVQGNMESDEGPVQDSDGYAAMLSDASVGLAVPGQEPESTATHDDGDESTRVSLFFSSLADS